MNYEEILKKASEEIDEILFLKKSIDAKMAKNSPVEEPAQEDGEPSDAQDDLIHNADQHDEEENLDTYAAKLSDEELYGLLSALSEEADQRGVGEDLSSEETPHPEAEDMAAPEMEEAPAEEEPAPEMEEAPAEEEQAPEMEEAPPMEEAPMEEAPAAEEPAPEMEEAPAEEGSDEVSIEGKIAGLADEELNMLLQAVSAELEARQGGQQAEGGEETLVASMEKSKEKQQSEVKAPVSEMKKSVQEEQISDLRKSVEELESVMESFSNKTFADPKVRVLEKSHTEVEFKALLGTDLQNWLLKEQKSGNRKVGSDLVVKAGLMKSEEMAESFYAELKSLGLKLPS